jgi:hypothetical protein
MRDETELTVVQNARKEPASTNPEFSRLGQSMGIYVVCLPNGNGEAISIR